MCCVISPFYRRIDELMRRITLPVILDFLKTTGRFYALSWTPESAPTKAHCFWDLDVYKTMEACCYYLIKKDDHKIRADVEEVVGYVKKAQWEDGFVKTWVNSALTPSTRKDEIAVTRGLLVYCAESPDNEFDLETTYVDTTSLRELRELEISGFKGVPIVEMDCMIKVNTDDALYSWDDSGLTVERKALS